MRKTQAEKEKKTPIFDRQSVNRQSAQKVKKGVFLILAAEENASVNVPFLNALKRFAKERKAQIVILPVGAHRREADVDAVLDSRLEQFESSFTTDLTLNKNLRIAELELNSQQINPLTGLKRIPHGEESLIVGHSKQHLESYPTGNSADAEPRIICTTGLITLPRYRSNRIGKIAAKDHILGCLIVEVANEETFHIRQIQCLDAKGSFCDLDRRYYADRNSVKERIEAIVVGDDHPGYTDAVAWKATREMIKALQPKQIFRHDWFDASSVSHHHISMSSKIDTPKELQTLAGEVQVGRKMLAEYLSVAPADCIINHVASNHPEHLGKYLDDWSRWSCDAANYDLALDCEYFRRRFQQDPLQWLLLREETKLNKKELTLRPASHPRVRFLDEDADMRVEGVYVSAHGDKGNGGTRGSPVQMESLYSNSITGHTHKISIRHGSMVVGGLVRRDMSYRKGPNGWSHANAIIHKGGGKQLIIIIKGRWRL